MDQTRNCMCSSTESGIQYCAPNRLGFGSCMCGLVDAGAPPSDAARPDAGGRSCDLISQVPCGGAEACRRSDVPLTNPRTGEPRCEPAGELLDWNAPTGAPGCRDESGRDLCETGLFCQGHGYCLRFCEPEGEPCPDTFTGEPQRCVVPDGTIPSEGIDPYCSRYTP